MKGLLSAIQFITILPMGKQPHFDPKKMVPFFPVVGLLLGIMVSMLDRILHTFCSTPTAALLDVIFIIIITGAFHLDGLGDSADGLFSHRPRSQALAIMKDSRVGIMGLVVIVCVLALKWAGIAGLDTYRSLTLIVVPAYARAGMLFGMTWLPYGRPQGGTGSAFFDHKLRWRDFWGLGLPLSLSLFLGWGGIILMTGFAVGTAAILWFYKKRMRCITGDMLGAMTELLEGALFLIVAVGGA